MGQFSPLMAAGSAVKQSLIFVHRWLGVLLCLLFLLWFPSGIVMMYWDFPGVTASDRLERSPALDPQTIQISPQDAAERLHLDRVGQARLNTFDGRPVYRFRAGRGETIVYADTGDEQIDVPDEMVARVASAWTGERVETARRETIEDVDQWTLQANVRDLKPLWKYTWPDGQQVYVSQASGEVVQATTTASRWAAYFGAIPHWFYFTPLRKHGPQWSRVVIWTSAAGTVSALLGLVIGVWMYSPAKSYRYAGAPTSIPYRGQKRWHTILGLIFGVGAVTWAFSGMLSMDPFPSQRSGPPAARNGPRVPQSLRGALQLSAFAGKLPQQALAELNGLDVRELELVVVADQPTYLATLGGGDTRVVPVNGAPRSEFDRQQLTDLITTGSQPVGVAEVRLLEQYDRYYLDRRRERPLPVLLARLNGDGQRYYIDPKTARVVGSYNSANWITRWPYHALHSLDFPWLYNYRPLWDIVVITFMVGGTALCVTSLILAWRVLGRKLQRMTGGRAADSRLEDLPLQG